MTLRESQGLPEAPSPTKGSQVEPGEASVAWESNKGRGVWGKGQGSRCQSILVLGVSHGLP